MMRDLLEMKRLMNDLIDGMMPAPVRVREVPVIKVQIRVVDDRGKCSPKETAAQNNPNDNLSYKGSVMVFGPKDCEGQSATVTQPDKVVEDITGLREATENDKYCIEIGGKRLTGDEENIRALYAQCSQALRKMSRDRKAQE